MHVHIWIRRLFVLTLDTVTKMNRDALAYLQVSRASSSDKQTLSWTMHVPFRKLPSSAKFQLKATLESFLQQYRGRSATHTKTSSCQTAELLCRNTVEQAKYYKLGTGVHAPSLPRRLVVVRQTYTCKCRLWALFLCAKPVNQSTKHHMYRSDA